MSPARILKWIGAFVLSLVLIFGVAPFLIISILATLPRILAEQVPVSDRRVAVIELEGIIGESKDPLAELYKQVADKNVKGVVLRINSPGGAVGPSQEVYAAVKKLKEKKPIVASMGSVAASGGLYAALGATKVFCQPGTLTGSIGVVLQLPNFRKVIDLVGLEMYTLKSGEFKDAGNSFREMTERDKELLQSTINEAYQEFFQAIVDSRGLDPEQVKAFADGRVLLGSQALKHGLVDAYGDVEDAARAIFEELGEPLPQGKSPDLFYPLDKMKYWKEILEAFSSIPELFNRSMRIRYVLP